MSTSRPTDPAAQVPTNGHDAKGRFLKRNPVCLQTVANALKESDTGEGTRPVWAPPSANGLFGSLPPRIRELAQRLFVVDAPSPNEDLLPPEESPGDQGPIRKRGQTPFAGTALRVLRTKGVRPLFRMFSSSPA